MKYFLLKVHPSYNTVPIITNWYGIIDKRNIAKGRSHKLPQRQLFFIQENKNTFFTDILFSPFFLVSDLIKNVIEFYEPQVTFKEIVLLDSVNALSKVYYLPIFEHVDCLARNSVMSLDRSIIKDPVIDMEKAGDNSIFYVSGVGNTYVIARLDIVESILRRNAQGIALDECKVNIEEL